MKKSFLMAMMLAALCIFAVHAEGNSSEKDEKQSEMETFHLYTGWSFTYFSINDITYYSSSSYISQIVEIAAVDKDLYKIVYMEAPNKNGGLKYVTLYLRTGDSVGYSVVHNRSRSILYYVDGIVVAGNPNCIELKGVKRE